MYGVQGVASSNPAAPTSNTKGFQAIAGSPFFPVGILRKSAQQSAQQIESLGRTRTQPAPPVMPLA
jgi:hypothetical protein